MDERCEMAGLLGITVCVSSGDRGDGAEGGSVPRVRFPASSPHVLACGGTHAVLKSRRAIFESVWNENFFGQQFSSGGGVSHAFGLPSWQQAADVPGATGGATGRGVPDVAAKADMLTGYPIRVRGFVFNMGGTSAAAPLWASLAARLNQEIGARIGFINPLIYANPSALRDTKAGSSGPLFSARADWDACTGLGTPKGGALTNILS
jgi:kumamolisin